MFFLLKCFASNALGKWFPIWLAHVQPPTSQTTWYHFTCPKIIPLNKWRTHHHKHHHLRRICLELFPSIEESQIQEDWGHLFTFNKPNPGRGVHQIFVRMLTCIRQGDVLVGCHVSTSQGTKIRGARYTKTGGLNSSWNVRLLSGFFPVIITSMEGYPGIMLSWDTTIFGLIPPQKKKKEGVWNLAVATTTKKKHFFFSFKAQQLLGGKTGVVSVVSLRWRDESEWKDLLSSTVSWMKRTVNHHEKPP